MGKKSRDNRKGNVKGGSERVEVSVAKSKRRQWLPHAVIFLFSFFLYINTLNHDYALDDDVNTRHNRFVQQGFAGIHSIITKGYYYGFNGVNEGSYRPMVLVNMAIEKELFGNSPEAGHFFNVLFYALACLLVFVFLKKLLKSYNPALPLIIALLYAAHPVHTEVAANIKSRDEILCFGFLIACLHFLLIYIEKNKLWILPFCLLSYFLSLSTKEYGLTLPFLIPVMLYVFTVAQRKKIIFITSLFFAIVGVYFLIRSSVMDNLAFKEKMDLVNNALVGAKTYSDRLATTVMILGKYLILLLYPHPLSFDYSYNQIPIVAWTDFKALLSLFAYIAIGVFSVIGIKKKDPVSFGLLFYCITLGIVSNIFVELGATLAERFLFIPSLGYCIAVVILLQRAAKKISLTKMRAIFYSITGLLIVLFSLMTYSRNKDWKDNLTLFAADVKACPNSTRTHFSLGSAYNFAAEQEPVIARKNAMLDSAVAAFKKSIEIYNEHYTAWYNLGVAYYNKGENNNARNAYRKCIEINPENKDALNNLGVILLTGKEYDAALKCFEDAVKHHPDFSDSYGNIGAVHHNKGDYLKAIDYYEKALKINPYNVNVLNNIIKACNMTGNKEKAGYYSSLIAAMNPIQH